jgi:N6-adenosine-specific RNA methylase IME4
MKKLSLITITVLTVSLLFATGINGCAGEAPQGGMSYPEPTVPTAPMEPGKWEEGDMELPPVSEPSSLPEERMIVRNGDISLVVDDVSQTQEEIAGLAERLGGWVVNSNIYGEEEKRGWISIRIPSDKFDQALGELRAMAVRVTSESTSTQDITEEYVDLESRLRNAEATESQYLALLERAEEVEDILRIYESLSQIRYEIEQIKGRMQYLEQISAMSMISINLEPALGPLVSPGWSASEALNSAVRGLTTFGQGLGTAFIWIGIFSPIWGTLLGVTYWRRRRRQKKAQSPD